MTDRTIQDFIAFFQVIIAIGAAVRIIFCVIMSASDQDGKSSYQKRAKNAFLFVIVSENIMGIIWLALSYF